MDTPTVSLAGYYHLVRDNRNFRLLWAAQIVSELGDWLYTVAVYSLLLEYTGSARAVALAFVLQVLPQFFIAPAAGVVNDRVRRKRVMIFTDWARAAIVFCMIFVSGPQLVWLLYLLLLSETLLWSFFEPGRSSVIPNVVPESDVVIANTLSSTTWSFNFAVGFAVGGALAAYFGRNTVFVINSMSFVLSALLISRMKFAEPHAENLPPLRLKDLADFTPIREGMRYVSNDWRLLATMFVKAGLGLMGANWVILPILGERVFPIQQPGFTPQNAGMLGMSLLMACRGIGAIIGPLVSGYWAGGSQRRMRLGILFGFVAGAIGYLALSGARNLWVACAAIVLAHGGGSTLWVFSTTLLQLQTEDRFRGRVFSAEFAFGVVTMSLSSYAAGVFIDGSVPVAAVAYATGMVMIVPAILWAYALTVWNESRTAPA